MKLKHVGYCALIIAVAGGAFCLGSYVTYTTIKQSTDRCRAAYLNEFKKEGGQSNSTLTFFDGMDYPNQPTDYLTCADVMYSIGDDAVADYAAYQGKKAGSTTCQQMKLYNDLIDHLQSARNRATARADSMEGEYLMSTLALLKTQMEYGVRLKEIEIQFLSREVALTAQLNREIDSHEKTEHNYVAIMQKFLTMQQSLTGLVKNDALCLNNPDLCQSIITVLKDN